MKAFRLIVAAAVMGLAFSCMNAEPEQDDNIRRQTVIASAYSICPDAEGVIISLEGSQRGVAYRLLGNGEAMGGNVYGTGESLAFDGRHGPGLYTVTATSEWAYDPVEMRNSVTVTEHATFTAGSIASDGETITAGATPSTISSLEDAVVAVGQPKQYRWYRNGEEIPASSTPSYTPTVEEASEPGMYVYVRMVKDGCNVAWKESKGEWTLIVEPAPEENYL